MSRLLVLIPARAGSVRIPNKNKRMLGGQPLIEWTLKIAKSIFDESDVIVSTDDEELLNLAVSYGFYKSVLRPRALATSSASLVDVALDLTRKLDDIDEYCGILLLQPTSPFRSCTSLTSFIEYVFSNNQAACVAVSSVHSQPSWMYTVMDDQIKPLLLDGGQVLDSNSEGLVCVNGFAYYVPIRILETNLSFIPENSRFFLINNIIETIDIDCEYEFEFASLVAERILIPCT